MNLSPRSVETPLGRLHIQVGDTDGPVMLFWPSLLMTGDMWLDQAAIHAEHYRVVLIDPPGAGRSTALTRGFSFDECAQCVVAILDHLDVSSAVFVGNSWGGMIGGTLAARHPKRIDAAVLMNCTGSAVALKQKLEYRLLSTVVRLAGGIPRQMEPIAIAAFTGPTSRQQRPEVIARIRDTLRKTNGRSAHWAIRSVVPNRPDQLELLSTIPIPVLVIAGAEDATFPVAETRQMAQAIPGARFEVLNGIAHLAGLEDPTRIAALVTDFLEQH